MTSLWLDRAARIADDPLPDPAERLDVVVVGAGITGLATALLLAEAGKSVAVVEARHVGAVTSGNTTAKLSLLQGTRLSRIRSHQSAAVTEAYLDANRAAMTWLLAFCAEHDVDLQRRRAVTFAGSEPERPRVVAEHQVALTLGLPVRWHDRLDAPFPSFGATVLEDQAQFDPMDVLTALVGQLREHGGRLHQHCRVRNVSWTGPPTLRLEGGETLTAGQVVLATGAPILDRGLYFAKTEPLRSYGLAFEGATSPSGMYLSPGPDARSVRDAPGDRLIVGGSGHVVGRGHSERSHLNALREWTDRWFPGAVETHHWSAQDYRTHDGIPFVGHLPRSGGRIHVATGFEKWGMTNGIAAALSISGQVLGESPPWRTVMGRRVTRPSGVREIVRTNLGVGKAVATGVARAVGDHLPGAPAPRAQDCGVIGVCTHLGGVLKWNDAEGSWDCPLHGSRFTAEGEVLEGPATRPLRRAHRPS